MEKNLSILEFLKLWRIQLIGLENKSSHTVSAYVRDIKSFAEFRGNLKSNIEDFVLGLTNASLRSFISDRLQKNITLRSSARFISSLRNFLNFARSKGIAIPENMSLIRCPKFSTPLPSAPTLSEIKFSKLLELGRSGNWIEKRDKFMIFLMYVHGLRISEVISLTMSAFNTEDMTILVLGKGNKERILPLHSFIVELLQDYQTHCPFKFGRPNILFSKYGKPLTRNNFAMHLRKSLVGLDLPYGTSPHSFRHSFATHLLAKGASLVDIQKMLGHSSLASTQIYTRVSNAVLSKMYLENHPSNTLD